MICTLITRQSRLERVLSVIFLSLFLALNACTPLPTPTLLPGDQQAVTAENTPLLDDTPTPFEPIPPTATSAATATPTSSPTPVPGLWIAGYIPEAVRQSLTLPAGVSLAESEGNALASLKAGGEIPLATWVYALVAPFPTIQDGISFETITSLWQGDPAGGRRLLLAPQTLEIFSAVWGPPSGEMVVSTPAEGILGTAWDSAQNTGQTLALIPFDQLSPEWKVLEVDGQNPLWKDFDPAGYPLIISFGLEGDPGMVDAVRAAAQAGGVPLTNRDPQRLTTVILTGVTALVRATAETMRRNGITYPARDVGPIMRQADIAHVSNEVPFAKGCPQPDPWQTTLRFCSRTEYIELLEEIGTDIVELTGDHFADWGPDAMRYTLDLYDERGWAYYGGGRDVDDGRQAHLVEHNGNKIAFIGCNAKGGGYATASKTNPGAVKCDWDYLQSEIARLTAEGYSVIATFQHFEYYTYKAQPNQEKNSRAMADAGAVIVSGSQAHQPQGFEFHQGALIHYGLGNLFFDQYHMGLPTAQGFLDRHVFYNGRHISTELIGIRFVDFARPRLMTADEREELLRSVFNASGW